MTEAETIQRIKDYEVIIKGIHRCWVGDNINPAVIKILSSSRSKDYHDRDIITYKAVCYSNYRSVSYQTSDPHDEGWRTESGDFYNESYIYIPAFVMDMEILNEQEVMRGLFEINKTSELKKYQDEIRNANREIQEAQDAMLEVLNDIHDPSSVFVIEHGDIVKGI